MGLNISQGGIANLLQRFTSKALPLYAEIKNRIKKTSCLGTDETGAKINGKNHWFWTWQNEKLTFISDKLFVSSFPVYVSQHPS